MARQRLGQKLQSHRSVGSNPTHDMSLSTALGLSETLTELCEDERR